MVTTVVTVGFPMSLKEIQLREAKANLSAVVDEAIEGQPSVITRHGKREAVVISFAEWERLSHVPSFGRLLMSAPDGAKTAVKRNKSRARAVDL
jgi:antitoxin Phd